jgi:transposase
MEEQSGNIRKTFKYILLPAPEQERTLATVVWRCRELYNAGLEERKAAWEKHGVSVTFAMQSAQLPVIKAVRPEYHEINAQVVQDVVHRLDKACAPASAACRRVRDLATHVSRARTAITDSPIRRSARTVGMVVPRWTAGC